jgi:hypothetical protein
MPVISISIISDGIPVDKMHGSDDDGPSCPIATKDAEANMEAKEVAVEEANYRDPSEDGGFKLTEICGNCGAYNQTEDMLDCIGDDSGDLGYCQLYKFMCAADHVCNDWVKGGPIKSAASGSERDIL